MFKRTISTHALALLLIGGGMAFTQTSCNRSEQQQTAAETRDSYSEFQDFVANTETRAEQVGNVTEAEYNEESTQLKSDYDTKVAAAEADMANWDDARRTEYEQLKTRYTTAYDRREQAYRNRGTMSAGGTDVAMNTNTTTGGSMSGTESSSMAGSSSTSTNSSGSMSASSASSSSKMPSNMAASLTASNARQTYEKFVSMVKQNEDQYQVADWRQINAEWRQLDQKYEGIKDDVSASDKREIAKEKAKYAAFKSYDKTESRVSQGADVVTGNREDAAAKGGGVRVGETAGNVAGDAKELGKDVGQGAVKVGKKVGSTAKGAYKEVKSEIKNTDND